MLHDHHNTAQPNVSNLGCSKHPAGGLGFWGRTASGAQAGPTKAKKDGRVVGSGVLDIHLNNELLDNASRADHASGIAIRVYIAISNVEIR